MGDSPTIHQRRRGVVPSGAAKLYATSMPVEILAGIATVTTWVYHGIHPETSTWKNMEPKNEGLEDCPFQVWVIFRFHDQEYILYVMETTVTE